MGVNHYLLPVTSSELAALLQTPGKIHDLVEQHRSDVEDLGTDGVAIVALTAESDQDPLSFIRAGGPDALSGWIGKYVEEAGRVVECEVDMGYGPASYYRNSFLVEVARKVQPITADIFSANCDVDWLDENHVYPTGWHDEGRREALIETFTRYRSCILATAKSGQHLLVWCG